MRVLALLLIASGTFLGQRFVAVPSSESNRTACPAPIAVEADPLGTLRAVCGPIPSESLPPLSGIAQWLDGHPIDLNEASEELLQRLPAVGPARAAAIVRERTSHRFTSVRDLERVSGIGPRIRTSLASWLSISERTVPSGATLDLRDRSGRRREALDG
jgi:competence protein ComEA